MEIFTYVYSTPNFILVFFNRKIYLIFNNNAHIEKFYLIFSEVLYEYLINTLLIISMLLFKINRIIIETTYCIYIVTNYFLSNVYYC